MANLQIWSKIHHQGKMATTLPDLNPCDFFLWGYLKARVYNLLPKTLEELKANIEREIKNISIAALKSTFLNFKKRCEFCLTADGGHLEVE